MHIIRFFIFLLNPILLFSNSIEVENKMTFSIKERDYIQKKKVVNLCVRKDIHPLDKLHHGEYSGVFGEYFKIVSNKSNIQFNLISIPSLENIDRFIDEKKCDMVSGINIHQKCTTKLNQTIPYYKAYLVIVTNIEKNFIHNMEFEKDDTLVLYKGLYKNLIKKSELNNKIKISDSFEEALMKVIENKNYATIVLNDVADHYIEEYGYENLKIGGYYDSDMFLNISMGVVKTEPMLLSIINKVIKDIPKEKIKELKENHKYTKLYPRTDFELILKIIAGFLFFMVLGLIRMLTLRRDNRKLYELIDSTIEGMAIFQDGKLTDCNEQILKMFGYESIDEIRGFTPYHFFDNKNYFIVKEKLEDNQKPYEIEMKRKDGTFFPALVKGTYIDKNRRVTSVIDISEIKDMQNKLKILNSCLEQKVVEEVEKNRLQQRMMLQQSRLAQMGEVINMIAHQWRQPLNNIFTMIQTIRLKYNKGKLDKEIMDQFKIDTTTQIKFLSNTIDEFRDFFKPEKDKEYFKVSTVIENSVSLFKPIIEKTDIEFNFHCNESIEILGFPNELGQVILNLLNNSKDALLQKNPKEKWITLSVNKVGENIVINTYDNAGGVDEGILYKIFDPYFSTKTDKNGTGLGMYMSKIIIEDHMNGKIEAKNEEYGLYVSIILKRKSD
jgi:PAS domain S-box-containing protein